MTMQSFLYESLNTPIQAIQCKYLLKSISKMQLRVQLFCIFQYKRMKNEIKVIKNSLCSKYKTQAQEDTETKRVMH